MPANKKEKITTVDHAQEGYVMLLVEAREMILSSKQLINEMITDFLEDLSTLELLEFVERNRNAS